MHGQTALPLLGDPTAEVLDLYATHKGKMTDWESVRDAWHERVFDLVDRDGWTIKQVAELHRLSTTRIHAIIARVAERRQKAAAAAEAAHPLIQADPPAVVRPAA